MYFPPPVTHQAYALVRDPLELRGLRRAVDRVYSCWYCTVATCTYLFMSVMCVCVCVSSSWFETMVRCSALDSLWGACGSE